MTTIFMLRRVRGASASDGLAGAAPLWAPIFGLLAITRCSVTSWPHLSLDGPTEHREPPKRSAGHRTKEA